MKSFAQEKTKSTKTGAKRLTTKEPLGGLDELQGVVEHLRTAVVAAALDWHRSNGEDGTSENLATLADALILAGGALTVISDAKVQS